MREMKKESDEALESYKIRIDALEIINKAYLAKIEALELLISNLRFLKDVKKSSVLKPKNINTQKFVSKNRFAALEEEVEEEGKEAEEEEEAEDAIAFVYEEKEEEEEEEEEAGEEEEEQEDE